MIPYIKKDKKCLVAYKSGDTAAIEWGARYNTPTAFWVDRMYRFARDEEIDLNELRTWLRKMTDEDLLRFGKAARFMCRDQSPRQAFVVQLEGARAEWKRHPEPWGNPLLTCGHSSIEPPSC
jgi:hypothetical protein